MKYFRYLLALIICLFALYGGYQLYEQYRPKRQFSEGFLQGMKDFGFETDPNSPDGGVSSFLKSENLGNPSKSLQNGSNGASSDLPLFLQNPTTSADAFNPQKTTVLPQSVSENFPAFSVSSTNQASPVNASTSIITHPQQQEESLSIFSNTFPPISNITPSQNPTAQENSSERLLTHNHTVQNSQAPDFAVNSFNNLDSQFQNNSNPQNNPPGISTTALDSARSVFANPSALPPTFSTDASSVITTANPSELEPTFVFPSPAFAPPEISENPPQETPPPPSAEPITRQSPFTFDVLSQPSKEINATATPQNEPVLITPVNPAGNGTAGPCVQETAIYQPRMATRETLRSLPPVEENSNNASIQPPAFTPQLAIVSLPPVTEQPVNLATDSAAQPENAALLQPPVTAAQPSMQSVSATSANAVVPLPTVSSGEIAPEIVAKVEQIGQLLRRNDVDNAYSQLSGMYFTEEMTAEERQYVAKHLDQLAGGLIFSRKNNFLEPSYFVKEDDTVETIATQYRITPQLLRKLNGIPENVNVVAGTRLKVIRGPLDARVYPEQHEMVVILRGKYACRFPLTIGSNYAGQTGEFVVQDKVVNPVFELAAGLGSIPPGDPANPLGSRWIQLSKESGTLGIHGTNSPESIGTTRKTAGVFGLREKDVAEVYDMLVVGSSVKIVR
ncbi:MAG: L,D-transpeptidase family protein [Planctomycetaceae bacterium]|jgi:hypothetical protein|nr:L,D-transpeptidase family protein [Planctomycetaceae bacterium]